jgi:hypothetical protein
MSKRTLEMEAALRCKVSPGMFSSERGVIIELQDGRKVAAFIDKRHVTVNQEPQSGREVDGYVKVSIVEIGEDYVIVDLPQPGLIEGPRLKVSRNQIVEED